MTDWLTATLLGIVEGVTEFLPISSTGHLLLAQHWLPQQSELFNVVIQCGAVLAVVSVFSTRVKELLTQWREPATRDYLIKLMTAFVITGVTLLVLKKAGLTLTKTLRPIAWATLIGGLLILAIEIYSRKKSTSTQITWLIAIAVGIAQVIAGACPGTSRSGATIMIALAMGLGRSPATEFSFLLGIPTMMAAGVFEIHHELKHHDPLHPENWGMVAIGTIVAAITAFFVVKWLLRFVQSHTFNGFGWYRIALGLVILLVLV